MAKPKKGGGARKSQSKKPAPKKTVYQLTPEAALKTLLRSCKLHKANADEYIGELREKIGNAVEKQHLHKKAFADVRKQDGMEPAILAAYYAHRDHYEQVLGLRDRADSAPTLDLGDEPGKERKDGDQEAGDGDGGKVTSIKNAGKRRTMGEAMREPGAPLADAPATEPATEEQEVA